MTNRFNNKVVVVTGGTSGIGLATAKAFAAEGAAMFITGRRQETLDAASKEIGGNVTGIRGDMARLTDIDRLYDAVKVKHAQIDILVANAGGGILGGDALPAPRFTPMFQVADARPAHPSDISGPHRRSCR